MNGRPATGGRSATSSGAGGAASGGRHPRHGLEPLLLHGVRFSLLAVVTTGEEVAFGYLRDTLEVSDSVLSKQLSALEEAGWVGVTKVADGRRARTWVAVTPQGRAAFERHREALRAIADGR